LCPELHHHCDLLGQSSSSHSPREPSRFGRSLGKHQSAFLDLTHPMGNGLSRRQSRAAISSRALCRRLNCGCVFFFPPARVDRPSSSRARVQALEQKDGAQKHHFDCHLRRGHCGGVRLYAPRAYPDRDARDDVFPARTRHREIRALGRCKQQLQRLNTANSDQEEQRPKSGNPVGRSHCHRCIVNRGKRDRCKQVQGSKNVKAYTAGLAKRELRNTNGIAANASMAVTRSPNGAVSEKYLLNPILTSVLSR